MFEQIVSGKEFAPGSFFKDLADHIHCTDGTTLSVQASRFHYCRPRDDYGPYEAVEVGFPSVEPPESWAQYFDGDWENDDRTGSVYGWVPVELVREFIQAHGGEK